MTDISLLGFIERGIKRNWDAPVLSNGNGLTLRYKDVARKIEKMHLVFTSCALKQGDRVALCGSGNINWGIVLLSIVTYGCVPVILEDKLTRSQICEKVNKSGARLLYVHDHAIDGLTENDMPLLSGIILLDDFFLTISKDDKLKDTCDHLNEYFCKKYPMNFKKEDVGYRRERAEETMLINEEEQPVTFQSFMNALKQVSDGSLLQRMYCLIAPEALCNVIPPAIPLSNN